MRQDYIGVDFDGTLAYYERGDIYRNGITYTGPPIEPMVKHVKQLIASGETVKIFTARVFDNPPGVVTAIEDWCLQHIGQVLEITNIKEPSCKYFIDDRARQVINNTGIFVEDLVDQSRLPQN